MADSLLTLCWQAQLVPWQGPRLKCQHHWAERYVRSECSSLGLLTRTTEICDIQHVNGWQAQVREGIGWQGHIERIRWAVCVRHTAIACICGMLGHPPTNGPAAHSRFPCGLNSWAATFNAANIASHYLAHAWYQDHQVNIYWQKALHVCAAYGQLTVR